MCIVFVFLCVVGGPLSLFLPAVRGLASLSRSSKLLWTREKTEKTRKNQCGDEVVRVPQGEEIQSQKVRAPDVPTRRGRGVASAAPPLQDLSGVCQRPLRAGEAGSTGGGGGTGGRSTTLSLPQVQKNCKSMDFKEMSNYKLKNLKNNCPRATMQGVWGQQVSPQPEVLFSQEELRLGDGGAPPLIDMALVANTCTGLRQPNRVQMVMETKKLDWLRQPKHQAMAAKNRTGRPTQLAMAAKSHVSGIPEKLIQGQHSNGVPKNPEPYFLRLRKALPWWEKHAPLSTVKLIQEGVHPSFPLPDYLESKPQFKTAKEEAQAMEVLSEYMEVGAVIKNPPGPTRHLVPWFVISKQENGKEKLRLISDCRIINQFFQTNHFKLDHWKNIFPFLKKGMWAGKIDLKHAYFHLGLDKQLQSYMRLQVAGDIYQFQAAAFGLSPLPQLWMQVMKVFQKIWRKKGIMCFIYLDDILIVNTTSRGVQKDLAFMLQTLEQAGMMVNIKKSVLSPCQEMDHLGFTLNLQDGVLEVPKEKIKTVRRELGKVLTHQQMTCRKMAAILGNIRSFLMAMPFLRAFTDHMLAFVNQQSQFGWDKSLNIPKSLQQEVRDLNQLTSSWTGRPFQEKVVVRKLHSDSSNHGWAGVDVEHGTVVQEFWRGKSGLHINVKELDAAVQTVKSLAKPREVVHLSVDNSVAFSYLSRGGGRLPHFNKMMRDFWRWTMEREIQVQVALVPSAQDQADLLSRTPLDKGDYTLDTWLFKKLKSKMSKFVRPEIDMFASPGNHKLKKFVSRYPHWESDRQDALACTLADITHC